MDERNADLAQLIGSRICHDLISPIGAISNGVELISMLPATTPPREELELIESSARAAAGRVKLYRVAFGTAAAGTRISAAELRGVLAEAFLGGRMGVAFEAEGDMARPWAQIGCLALLCFETALVRGGSVRAVWRQEGWQISSSAAGRRVDGALWGLLSGAEGAAPEITPSLVQFRLLADSAASMGRRVSVADTDEALALSV